MRSAAVIVLTKLLLDLSSLLPLTHGFGTRNPSLLSHRHRPQRQPTTICTPLRRSRHRLLPSATLPTFHLTQLCAATASSAGESEAAGSSSSSLPSTLPSLRILEENQKYFDDNNNINNDDDDEMNYKVWSVTIKKTADELEKSSLDSDNYNNNDGIRGNSSIDENEWDSESSEEMDDDKAIGIETTDNAPISNIIIAATDDDDDTHDDSDNDNEIDSAILPVPSEDDMDNIANMLMERPPTLRQQVQGQEKSEELVSQQSAGEGVMLLRPPPLPPGEENDKSLQALVVDKNELLMKEGEKDNKVEEESSLVTEEVNNSKRNKNDLIFISESSQASLSRTYSIDEAYKIFNVGGPANVVNDVDVVGVDINHDNDADTSSPNEYDRQLVEASELIASLRDRENYLERELNNDKIRLEAALEAKACAMTEVDELIASLKNQESIMERELYDGKVKLEEALEGKARAAAEYGYAVNKYINLKDSMASMVANQTKKFVDDQYIIANAKVEEEKARGKANLRRLSDEYEGLLSRKSRKIYELRQALRSANDKKRRLERQLRLGSKENESKLRIGKEERERLMAEIT
jgi:hypothetical protein